MNPSSSNGNVNRSATTSADLIAMNKRLRMENDTLLATVKRYVEELEKIRTTVKRVTSDNHRMAIFLRDYSNRDFEDRQWASWQQNSADYIYHLEKYLHRALEPDLDLLYFTSVLKRRFDTTGNLDFLLFDPRMRNVAHPPSDE